ncbi:hypothetical protein [Bradyrhizobium centrosematis]
MGWTSGLGAQDVYRLRVIAVDLKGTQVVDGNKDVDCILPRLRMLWSQSR